MKNENLFIGGAIFAATASSLCCVLPLAAVVFGLGAFSPASSDEKCKSGFQSETNHLRPNQKSDC